MEKNHVPWKEIKLLWSCGRVLCPLVLWFSWQTREKKYVGIKK